MIPTDKTEIQQSVIGISPDRQRAATGFLVLAFALYAIMLATHIGAYACGGDASGYLNSAVLFGRGASRINERVIPGVDLSKLAPETFIPVGFSHARAAAGGQMSPGYPPGLPLLIAGAAKITGWNAAPHATIFILSLLGILATAWLAHEWGLPGIWPWIAAMLIACSPVYVCYSLQLMSDMPALVFATLAVVLAWKSRARRAWAAASGAALALAVLVRPNNMLILLPAAVCLGLDWRRWALLVAGGLPGAVFLCLYNYHNYGAPQQTGYGNLSHLFGAGNVPPTLLDYAVWLPAMLSPAGILFPGLPFLVRRAPRKALVLIVWILSILGFFTFYRVTRVETWWGTRFLLPAFPPMITGSLWVLRSLLQTGWAVKFQARLAAFFRQSFHPASAVAAWIAAGAFSFYELYDQRHEHPWYFHYPYRLAPVALAGAFWFMRARLKPGPAAQLRITCITLLACMIFVGDRHWIIEKQILESGHVGLLEYNACAWANAHLPANSVVYCMLASGTIFCYTPFTPVRFDRVDRSQQNEIGKACAASGQPVYAMVHDYEKAGMIDGHGLSGHWLPVKEMNDISIWRFDPGGSSVAP